MKKLYHMLTILLSVSLITFLLTNSDCDKSTEPDETLPGEWELISADTPIGEKTPTDLGYEYVFVTLNEDGTFDARAKAIGVDEVTGTGTWEVNGDELTINLDADNPLIIMLGITTLTEEYDITGKILSFTTEITYLGIPVQATLNFEKQ